MIVLTSSLYIEIIILLGFIVEAMAYCEYTFRCGVASEGLACDVRYSKVGRFPGRKSAAEVPVLGERHVCSIVLHRVLIRDAFETKAI